MIKTGVRAAILLGIVFPSVPRHQFVLLRQLRSPCTTGWHHFDVEFCCRDGYLSPSEVSDGLSAWGLNLQPDMFSQFVEVNFLYADRDLDGRLSRHEWIQLFKLMSEVCTHSLLRWLKLRLVPSDSFKRC